MIGGTPNVLVVRRRCRSSTLQEFVAYVKANPGKVSYGSAGPGTLTHLAMEQFKVAGRSRYRARAVSRHRAGDHRHARRPDAGDVPRPCRRAAAHQGRQVRPLAVTGTKRHPLLPDVPTFDESGYKGFDGVQWYGIVGPANLPAPIVKRLNDEINKLLAEPDLARAAVRRSAGADADDAGAIRPVHPRRHRALDEARQGPQASRSSELMASNDMAHNTQVAADHDAPPITRILADFVADASVARLERRASSTRRTARFLNWVGCAIGASRHETVEAALAAVHELEPAPQATSSDAASASTSPARRCSTASPRTRSTSTTRI